MDDKPTHIWMTNEDYDTVAPLLHEPMTHIKGLEIVTPNHALWPMLSKHVEPGKALVADLSKVEYR